MAASYSNRNTTVVLEGFRPVDPSFPRWTYDDLTNSTFGKLTVKKYAGRRHVKGKTLLMWICRCECGKLTLASTANLTTGNHDSCGCTVSKKNWKRKKTNIRDEPLYQTWNGIIHRTTRDLEYILRGVCDGFREFYHFAKIMGPKPGPEFSVDRIENNDGYFCGCCEECVRLGRKKNVRWATQDIQCNNKGNNHRITYAGRTMTISQWAKESGMPRKLIRSRLEHDWTPEQIFETAKLKNGHGRLPLNSSEESRQQCAAEYQNGASLSELGAKYGSDRHNVARILKRMGIKLRTRSDWMKNGLSKKRERRTNQRSLFGKS